MRRITLALVVAALVGAGPRLVAQQARGQQPPSFRSGIELVMVDVGVMDRQGLPVRGLGTADFTVTVAGVPRKVVSAEFVDEASAQADFARHADGSRISTNEGGGVGRLYVFVVDQATLDHAAGRNVTRAAQKFIQRLTPNDRSSLVLLPVGTNIGFTWAHDRIVKGLDTVAALGGRTSTWEYGSLADARDIANHNPSVLRTLEDRQCGVSTSASAGTGLAGPPGGGAAGSGGTQSGGGTTGSGSGSAPGAPGAPAGPTSSGLSANFEAEACARSLQMQAETAWREVELTSESSIAALRQVLQALARVPGDKTVVLISGGWPLNDNEEMSIVSSVASEAAAARATIFPLFVPRAILGVDRREMSTDPARDQYLHSGPLETLAAMTGGGYFRVDVGAEGAFDRLSREMSGHYRLGIQRDPTDTDGKERHLKVQVARTGTLVRARDLFDVRTYEDRDWAARLASALEAPLPATGLGLRITSYVSADPHDPSHVKLVLTGEAFRLQPGEVSFRVMLRDLSGPKIGTAEEKLGEATEDAVMPFTTQLSIPRGSYVARVAVIDSTGRVGSVDHRFDARPVPIGQLSGTGPILIRVPASADQPPQVAMDGLRQDDRLAMEINLEGEKDALAGADVEFSISSEKSDTALVHSSATVSAGTRDGMALAQAVADMRLLPPGDYVVRAQVSAGGKPAGELRRAFTVLGSSRATASGDTVTVGRRPALAAAVAGTAPPFAINQALAPRVRNQFLDRIAARPDETSPEARALIDAARADSVARITIPDALAKTALGAFVSGLALLEQKQLDPAANAFRTAMRAAPDFYPAMVYLGACYAAGGKDKEAIAAWRTALIREEDTLAVHELLADGLLREGRDDMALETLDGARTRWPDDLVLQRKYVRAALRAGEYTKGLTALDGLIDKKADDDTSLTLGLLVLYEAFTNGTAIESPDADRARMTRLADVYKARGGASQALVDMWVAAALKK